jgi:hypothetical protein
MSGSSSGPVLSGSRAGQGSSIGVGISLFRVSSLGRAWDQVRTLSYRGSVNRTHFIAGSSSAGRGSRLGVRGGINGSTT